MLSNLGTVELLLGHPEEAVRLFQLSLGIAADQPDTHLTLGSVLEKLGREKEALKCYSQAIAHRSGFDEAMNRRDALVQRLTHSRPDKTSSQPTTKKSEGAESHYKRAQEFIRSGRITEALASLDRAISLKPDSPNIHFTRGVLLKDLSQLQEALASLDSSITADPTNAQAYNVQGVVLLNLCRHEDALTSFESAIALKSDYADAYTNRGIALNRLNRPEESLASIEQGIALDPDSAPAHNTYGIFLSESGRATDAVPHFEKALAINPDYVAARWALAFSHIPDVYSIDQDPRQLRTAFSEQLDDLGNWFSSSKRMEEGHIAVGRNMPFFLSYQEEDNKALLSRHGALCAKVMSHWQSVVSQR